MKCKACGGCGILLIGAWDDLESADGKVFVDTCDSCTTNTGPTRSDASYVLGVVLNTDILLVRNPGHSFKDALVASKEVVHTQLTRWNDEGRHLKDILVEIIDAETRLDT